MIRVLVVDDQAMVRRGLALLLGAEPDVAVVAEAADAGEARRRAAEVQPDVVLMDIRMPGLDGMEATRLLVDGEAGPAVVVLTTFGDDGYVEAAAAGQALLDPAITRSAIGRWTGRGTAPDPAFLAEVDKLTAREREVLVRLGHGQTNDEIAKAFGVERSTVKSHVAAVLRKLGLRDRVDAAVRAHRAGLVGSPPPGGDEVPPRG